MKIKRLSFSIVCFIVYSCQSTSKTKEIVTLDELTSIYGCLSKQNTFPNGINNFIVRHNSNEIELRWASDHLDVLENGIARRPFSCIGYFTDSTKKEKLDW